MVGGYPLFLAEIGPEHMVFIFLMCPFAIPIVAMILKHRLRVIELKSNLKSNSQAMSASHQKEMSELRGEVKELKEMVHQQMIAVDNVIMNQSRLIEKKQQADDIQTRIGS